MAKKSDIAKTLGHAVKSVAKAIVKAGLSLYDAAEAHMVEAREGLIDLVSEVSKEMNGGLKRKVKSKKNSSSGSSYWGLSQSRPTVRLERCESGCNHSNLPYGC